MTISGKLLRMSMTALAVIGLFASGAEAVKADDWPTKPVTIVVAYPAGGGTDAAIRAMTDILSSELGQPVLVQNVGGAGGGVAASQVIRNDPDGYTLLATNSTSITLAPLVQPAMYDVDSFDHVAILGDFQNAIFTGPQQPYNTLDELIETVIAQNRPMTYASQLAIDRLLMHYIAKERGVALRPVPVNGGSGAVQAVLAGDVDVAFSGGSWAPIVAAGDAKALFAASHDRLPMAPDLVGMGDLGFPFGVTSRISVHAPRGVPAERLERLSAAFEAASASELVQRVGEMRSMDMTFRGYAEAERTIAEERATYEQIIEAVGLEALTGGN